MRITTTVMMYVIIFLSLTTAAMTGFAIYRGEVISNLQLQLIQKDTTNVQLTLDVQGIADSVAVYLQKDMAEIKESRIEVTREIEKVIKDPVYINTCIDGSGMRLIEQAAAKGNAAKYALGDEQPVSVPFATE